MLKTYTDKTILDWRRQLTFSTPGKTSTEGELVIERIGFLPKIGTQLIFFNKNERGRHVKS